MFGQRLNCPNRCYHGQCTCAGYNPFGELLRMEAEIDLVENLMDGNIAGAIMDEIVIEETGGW